MQVLLSTYGSRGDVQPLVALAMQLQALGAEVRVCVPPDEEFAHLTARAGVVLAPAFASVREWLKANMSKRTPADITRLAAEMMVARPRLCLHRSSVARGGFGSRPMAAAGSAGCDADRRLDAAR